MVIEVLNHGYVRLVETWGSDERIIEAARMSTQKGFEGWGPIEEPCPKCGSTATRKRDEAVAEGRARPKPCDTGNGEPCDHRSRPGDEKLLAFLWKNNHATPFEMAGAIIEVQAPIFVFREWHRHRTQSFNEMSARYAPLPDVNYIPTVERVLANSKTNRQAGTIADADEMTEELAVAYLAGLDDFYGIAQRNYEMALKNGVPKEIARIVLPVGRYSRMRASTNLRNWLGFLTLRADAKAQWEIQQYAYAVKSILEQYFPRTLALFNASRE